MNVVKEDDQLGDTRTKNTSRNILAGLWNRFSTILLSFVNRTIIIYILGAEFSGLNSLFISILGVLNIAELGIDTAIVQSMYKPIAEGNKKRICELLTIYRKSYHIVGMIILGVGLLLIPFIPSLINEELPVGVNIYVLYILYLLNSVISYFLFAYRESLLYAHQRDDISQIFRTNLLIGKNVAQAIVLLVFKQYYVYLIIEILFTVLTNLWIGKVTQERYPEYQCVRGEKVRMSDDIKNQLKGLVIGNVCDKARNSLDSIILSAYLGLTVVAIYNNYYYIYSALYGVMLTVCDAMSASVGNSIVTETVEKNYDNLQKFSFMIAWISGWCAICMLCLYQPFMKLWMGEELMLSNYNIMLFCVYFYAINMNNIRNQFVLGTGIWWKLKYSNIAEAIGNTVLNLVLGKLFGITGILWATIITIVVFNFLWRTIILFKNYFSGMNLKLFLRNHCYWIVCILIAAGVTWNLTRLINTNTLVTLIVNGVICVFVPNLILLVLFFKTEQFQNTKQFVKNMLK